MIVAGGWWWCRQAGAEYLCQSVLTPRTGETHGQWSDSESDVITATPESIDSDNHDDSQEVALTAPHHRAGAGPGHEVTDQEAGAEGQAGQGRRGGE